MQLFEELGNIYDSCRMKRFWKVFGQVLQIGGKCMAYFDDVGILHEGSKEIDEIIVTAKEGIVEDVCLVCSGQLHDGNSAFLTELTLSGHELGVKADD